METSFSYFMRAFIHVMLRKHTPTCAYSILPINSATAVEKMDHQVERQHVVCLFFFPAVFERVDINSYCSVRVEGFQTHARTNKHDLPEHAAIEQE